jgi:hypothetical protein
LTICKELWGDEINDSDLGLQGISHRIRLFLNDGLEKCSLRVHLSHFPSLLDDIAMTCGLSLQHLQLSVDITNNTHNDMKEHVSAVWDDRVAVALSSLQRLRQVCLPGVFWSPKVISVLSRLPHLRSCTTVDIDAYTTEGPITNADLVDGAFGSVESFRLNMTVPEVLWLLLHPHCPHGVTSLALSNLHGFPIAPANSWASFFHALPSAFPLLVDLTLAYSGLYATDSHYSQSLNLSVLLPLSKLTHLRTLQFHFPYHLMATRALLRDFAAGCPQLRRLSVNTYRDNEGGEIETDYPMPTLLLEDLCELAHYCPELDHISLPFNALSTAESTGSSNDTHPTFTFKRPIKLSFSGDVKSDLRNEPEPLAARLVKLFPYGCTVGGDFMAIIILRPILETVMPFMPFR